jgi:hypothetical protein
MQKSIVWWSGHSYPQAAVVKIKILFYCKEESFYVRGVNREPYLLICINVYLWRLFSLTDNLVQIYRELVFLFFINNRPCQKHSPLIQIVL